MKNFNNIAKYLFVTGIVISLAFVIGSQTASAQTCPFTPSSTRTVVNFSNIPLVWGKTGYVTQVNKEVTLPAGNYKVSLYAYDAYSDRKNVTQPNESYFVDLRNGSTVVARSAQTPDLQDKVASAYFAGTVNSSIVVSQAVNNVMARHSNYLNLMPSANSVTAGCAAFDLITTPVNDLNGSCTVNPSSVNTGGYLNWNATASGGTGSYNYSWTGTDDLYGNSSYVSKTYSTAGTKTGVVTITSGAQSITKNCSATVTEVVNNNLNVSCRVSPTTAEVNEDVTWYAYVSGGTGSYTYSWSGSENLSGNNREVIWSYDNDGTKTGRVNVISGSQFASATCSVEIEEEYNDDLSISCYANPSNPQIGTRMNWYVRVSGGDGDYDYDWEGSDGLNSSSKSPAMTYYSPGSKYAEVTVRDGNGNRDTDTCYANINSVLAYSQSYQPPMEGIYLSQIPYTGVADNFKLGLFVSMLALFSAWIAYIVISYKKGEERNEINR